MVEIGKVGFLLLPCNGEVNLDLGISNDPYLCGILGGETVEGFQDTGVITSAKVGFITTVVCTKLTQNLSITLEMSKKPTVIPPQKQMAPLLLSRQTLMTGLCMSSTSGEKT